MSPMLTCDLSRAYLASATCLEQVQASSAASPATDRPNQNLWLLHAQQIVNSTAATATSCYTFAPASGAARFAIFAFGCYYN